MTEIHGIIDPQYENIADAFQKNFSDHGEIGAALCVYHNHQKVIDVWAGFKDLKKEKQWKEDTVVPFFSTTKAIAAAALAICHSRNLFQYEDKVTDYWPEFAQSGKENITIEQLLQHRAGLSAIDTKLTPEIINNPELLDNILAKQKPYHNPGDYQGYHVWNIGWYISALLARIDPQKRRLKPFLEQEILSHISGDLRIGIDQNFDLDRVATLLPISKLKGMVSMPFKFVKEFFNPMSLTYKSMLNPSFVANHANFNRVDIMQMEMGSGNGIGNAQGLASLMDGIFNPAHPLHLSEKTLEYLYQYPEPPAKGFEDVVFKQEAFRFHAGFMKPSEKHNYSPSQKSIGGFGAGGSFVFIDPDNKLTIAYTMNKMDSRMMNMEREVAIRDAAYKAI